MIRCVAINGAGVRVCEFSVPDVHGMSFEGVARATFHMLYPEISTLTWRFVKA